MCRPSGREAPPSFSDLACAVSSTVLSISSVMPVLVVPPAPRQGRRAGLRRAGVVPLHPMSSSPERGPVNGAPTMRGDSPHGAAAPVAREAGDHIFVEDVKKSFGTTAVLRGVTLHL